MTPAQREKALVRLAAFQSWSSGQVPIDQAVTASELSKSRFYRLAADWRTAPSLEALGALTGSGAARPRLNPEVVNALQAKVAGVVRLNADASVSQLVRMLVAAAGVEEGKLPGVVTLRGIVEAELRRVRATKEAGHAVQFDCSAINLPQASGRPHILFTCLDAGTRLILGAAVAPEPDAEQGYRAAAANAQERLAGELARLPWALRFARFEMTAGADRAKSAVILDRLLSAGVQANPQIASVPRRYGRYFRKLVGTRIGRIEITPARTESGDAMPDNGDMTAWSPAEASAAVARALEDHNERLLPELRDKASGRPPEDLELLLAVLSGDG